MSDPTDQAYWEKFYSEVPLDYQNSRVALLTSFLCSDIEEAFLPPGQKKKILEVGCGGALFTGIMARRGYEAACSDFSPDAVALARKNLAGLKPPVEVFQGDVTALPVPAGSFDLVYCGGLLDIFDDPSAAFREIERVLRPGGVLVAMIPSRNFSIQTLADYFNSAVHGLKALLGAPSPHWRKYRLNISHAPSRPASFYGAAAGKCGFAEVSLTSGYPVPELSLPGFLKRGYVELIKRGAWLLRGRIFRNNALFRSFGIYYCLAARKKDI